MIDYNNINSEKVISQVNQFISSLSRESKEKIPVDMRRFFEENDTHKKENIIDWDNFNEEDLEEETKAFFTVIAKYLKEIDYIEVKPSWRDLEVEGKYKEAVYQLDLELATNFFNINNYYSDRQMVNIKYIYNIRFFGKTNNEEKLKKLEPFRALCNVFCLVHNKFENSDEYQEALKMNKYVEHELKNLL